MPPTLHEMKIFYGVICKRVERHFCQKTDQWIFQTDRFSKTVEYQ